MTNIQIFNFEENQVRTVMVDNSPFFVAKDVAEALGYSNTRDAIAKHVDEDDKLVSRIATPGQSRNMTVINESGVYALIFSSKLQTAQKFKRWVTSEVLPSIRKHGAYMTTETIEQVLTDPDTIIKIATNLKLEQQKRLAAEQAVIEANQIIEAQQPKVHFADSVSASDTSILIRELAKLLKQSGVDIGEKRLFVWLRQNGYLIKRLGSDYNLPTQKSMDLGLFEIKESTVTRSDGVKITRTSKVTGKGQVYFINKLKGSVTV